MGLFQVANNGTFFLDEIAEISTAIQTKLLRVLQEGEIRRVGETQVRKVDVRIIAATNKHLTEEVKAGRFREDLYYRLQVVNIHLPSLRERRSDIPSLVRYFARRAGFDSLPLSKEAADFLSTYDWPGNVRELENSIQRSLLLSRGNVITVEQLSPGSPGREKPSLLPIESVEASARNGLEEALNRLWEQILSQQEMRPLKMYQWLEVKLAEKAMQRTNNNQVQAAKLLGISRNTLRQRLGL